MGRSAALLSACRPFAVVSSSCFWSRLRSSFATAPSNDFDIVVMNADGSNEVSLTRAAGTRDEDPDWQPALAPRAG